ncbi:MAG: hypothetical protein H6944_00900 [Zoogloeaceae bacterium]|uniref:hypothetical protein n=1 Tax=Denitromonas sp. TaxID=2734609 RepID=UPI001D660477|nr:hypothetical protein [Rhodocyclaceae bacterium]MCP5220235.1 hypothetical protein [Zoogloeaceae bacterium]
MNSDIADLDKQVRKLEVKPKEGRDRLSILGAVLVPLSVMVAGFFVSSALQDAEIASAERIASSNKQIAEIGVRVEQAQLIHNFTKTLTSGTSAEKELAITLSYTRSRRSGRNLLRW